MLRERTEEMTSDTNEPGRRPAPDEAVENLATRMEGRLDELAQRFDKTDWVELLAAVILALATIIAAWSAYQATRWGGEQASAANLATTTRTAAGQATTIAASEVGADIQMFTAWLTLAAEGNERGMAVIEERLRDEMVPAFEAWLALAPPGEIPPDTPFELPEYEESASGSIELAVQLNQAADASAARSADANQTGDNFVLVAVVMASVLFFAGVGTKFRGRAVRIAMLVIALLVFAGGLAFMLSLPQNVGLG